MRDTRSDTQHLPEGATLADEVFLLDCNQAAPIDDKGHARGRRTGKSLADYKAIFQAEILADLERTQTMPQDGAWKRVLATNYELKDSIEALGRRIFDIEKALAEGIKINTDPSPAPALGPASGNEATQSSWNPAFGDGPGEARPSASIKDLIRRIIISAVS